MTIERQTARLQAAVAALARSMTSLSDECFLARLNGWSPRDMVAHLIGWNRYVIEGSRQIRQRRLPFYDVDPGENYSTVNAVLVREYPSRNREALLVELEASTRELTLFLQSLDPDEWNRDYGVRHQGEVITIRSTIDDLIGDYGHHTKQVNAIARGR